MKETIAKLFGRRIMNTIGGASVFFGLMVLILKGDLVSQLFSSAAILVVASGTICFSAGYIVGRLVEFLFPTHVGKKPHKEPTENIKKHVQNPHKQQKVPAQPTIKKDQQTQQKKNPEQTDAMFSLLNEFDEEGTGTEKFVPDDTEYEEPAPEQEDESPLQEEIVEDSESEDEPET